MAEGVLMPKAGITVEECVITEWVKKKGDSVAVGDVLFTYETDKAAFECEAAAAGELLEILWEEGDEVPVLEVVCVIGQPGESASGIAAGSKKEEDGQPPAAAAGEQKTDCGKPAAESLKEVDIKGQLEAAKRISPRARMAAHALEVTAELAAGTGPEGRIIERDVRGYVSSRKGDGFGGRGDIKEPAITLAAPEAVPEAAGGIEAAEYEDIKFSGVRKATAKAMMKSLSTMAQLTHHHSFDAAVIQKLRKRLKQGGERLELCNITLNDMVLFTVSRVLPHHPDLNAHMLKEDTIRRFWPVHLGVAVDTPRGLFVPVVRNAQDLSLTELAAEVKRLAQLCKDGKAGPEIFAGGTFTVSNLGALGVEMFTPVINPPQTGILGVNGITTRVQEEDGVLKGYPAMGLSLTYDHRAVDGAPASKFLKEVCMALENFDLMLMK